MRSFGLIGHPLSHSFSKKYFKEKFEKKGLLDCLFENYDLADIRDFQPLLKDIPSLEGICVTIPYKQSVIDFLDQTNDAVKIIGACNSIKIIDGKLFGYNTDAIGFEKSLLPKLRKNNTGALVLGTGGSAKAVTYVLNKLGIDFIFVSRNVDPDHSKKMIHYNQVTPELLGTHTLIINCTPVGMYPKIDQAPQINYSQINSAHYLFDLTYNPEESLFLKHGKQQGAQIQNGFDMLKFQAEASWEIWNKDKI